jgi:Flp pilus assembly protein TadB
MIYIWPVLISVILGLAIYQLIPAVICRLDTRLAQAGLGPVSTAKGQSALLFCKRILPDHWLSTIRLRLIKAGYFAPHAPWVYLSLLVVPIPALVWTGWLIGINNSEPVWIGILLICLVNSRISVLIKLRQKAFSKALFKIYRFLDLQLAAGIRVTDSLRGLPETVQDLVVQPVLSRFSALYSLTLDLDQAFAEIRQAFPGPDSELLATHLRQCIQTGQAGRSLLRMEELLFARYFNMMQAETLQIRTRLLLTAMLGISPGIVLFLYPLIFDALQAVHSVFG